MTSTPVLGVVTIGQTPRPDEIPMEHPVPRVAKAAHDLAESGAAVVVIACAGGFPDVPCPVPLVLPGRVVPAVAGAISRSRRIGVVTPNRAQVPFATQKWTQDGFDPLVAWASPFDEREMLRAADEFAGHDLDLVVLDCMGHDDACRAVVARRTGRPVIAAQSLVARVAALLLWSMMHRGRTPLSASLPALACVIVLSGCKAGTAWTAGFTAGQDAALAAHHAANPAFAAPAVCPTETVP